jgi:hypothetical protein
MAKKNLRRLKDQSDLPPMRGSAASVHGQTSHRLCFRPPSHSDKTARVKRIKRFEAEFESDLASVSLVILCRATSKLLMPDP